MSESKTFLFGGGDSNLSAMLPALLQNKGIDPASLSAIMNSNRGGLLGNNGFGDIIALIVIAAIFGNGNFGFGNNGNNNQAATAEREMLMQALNRNGVDINQLAQAVNCSSSQILQGINQVANSICGLGNQMGQNTNQIITAILQGNNALTSQLASCCCDLKQIMTQGFASIGYATERQTCSIEKAIAASTSTLIIKSPKKQSAINIPPKKVKRLATSNFFSSGTLPRRRFAIRSIFLYRKRNRLNLLIIFHLPLRFSTRLAPTTTQGLGDDPLQLSVDRAKLIGSPLLEGIHSLTVNAKHKAACI